MDRQIDKKMDGEMAGWSWRTPIFLEVAAADEHSQPVTMLRGRIGCPR